MKINYKNLTVNQKLAMITFLLGLIALFMSDPLKAHIVTVDVNDMAIKIKDKSANIKVEELADWIIKGRADYSLIDLREEAEFMEYNIPSSLNVNITHVTNTLTDKVKKIILYSDDNIQAAQAWFLLKAKNYRAVYLLQGGIDEWKNTILFPKLVANPTKEQSEHFRRMTEICKFFGGQPQTGAQDVNKQGKIEMSKMKAPASLPSAKPAGKARKDGC
ncbi:MAG: Rhodanese domain protein [Ignavibacteria bacterium]|nr:Rhodanese domain protein [Ignavibacteria bacterium]